MRKALHVCIISFQYIQTIIACLYRSAYTNVVPIPGMVPFPLLLAVIFDTACEVFQYKCGEKGSCWVYDSDYLATGLAIWVVCIKLLSTSMYFLGENRSFITFHMFMFSTHVRVLQTCVCVGGGCVREEG